LTSFITNEDVNTWFDNDIDAGALGGKLHGAGGGFLLFYAPSENHEAIVSSLPELMQNLEKN
jgi:D-glycero-alpha-D-manno-heptose-7-phosphate kinase